jgi:hypothetical protein
MGVAIGGFRGYEGFEGYGLDSYQAGALDFEIIPRPVFGRDPLDDAELDAAKGAGWRAKWDAANLPIVTRWRAMLEADGVPPEEIEAGIAALLADQQRQDDLGIADTVTGITQ